MNTLFFNSALTRRGDWLHNYLLRRCVCVFKPLCTYLCYVNLCVRRGPSIFLVSRFCECASGAWVPGKMGGWLETYADNILLVQTSLTENFVDVFWAAQLTMIFENVKICRWEGKSKNGRQTVNNTCRCVRMRAVGQICIFIRSVSICLQQKQCLFTRVMCISAVFALGTSPFNMCI